MIISYPLRMSIQTHNANELVGKIPRQQLIGGFSGCTTDEDNTGEDCMGKMVKEHERHGKILTSKDSQYTFPA